MVAKRHSAKNRSAKRQHRMKKGGNPATFDTVEESVVEEAPAQVVEEETVAVEEMTGGRRRRHRTHKCSKKCRHAKRRSTKRRSTKRRGGAGILATAALPFGLLGLNNLFSKKRSTKRSHGRRHSRKHHKRSFRKSRK